MNLSSSLFLYLIESNTVSTSAKIYGEERLETYPVWSPEGQYLYFCSAPKFKVDRSIILDYQEVKYDLMRIRYDPERRTWGTVRQCFQQMKQD